MKKLKNGDAIRSERRAYSLAPFWVSFFLVYFGLYWLILVHFWLILTHLFHFDSFGRLGQN